MKNIGSIMTPVETIEPEATVQRAAEIMRDLDVGALPVCDGERLIGMITDRDIAIRTAAEGLDPGHCRVRDTMTATAYFCLAEDDVVQAALQMQERRIRRLPVLDRGHRLVGTISLGDIAQVLAPEESGKTLEEICRDD